MVVAPLVAAFVAAWTSALVVFAWLIIDFAPHAPAPARTL